MSDRADQLGPLFGAIASLLRRGDVAGVEALLNGIDDEFTRLMVVESAWDKALTSRDWTTAATILSIADAVMHEDRDRLLSISVALHRLGDCPEAIGWLLAHGASAREPTAFGWPCLLTAVDSQWPAVVAVLIDNGADVNEAQYVDDKLTPLMAAALVGNGEIVRMLLDHGANKVARSAYGLTALDLAQQQGHAEVVKILTEVPRSRRSQKRRHQPDG